MAEETGGCGRVGVIAVGFTAASADRESVGSSGDRAIVHLSSSTLSGTFRGGVLGTKCHGVSPGPARHDDSMSSLSPFSSPQNIKTITV